MDQYLFTNFQGNRKILLGYEEGILREFKIEGQITDQDIKFMKDELPWREYFLTRFEKTTRGKVTKITVDLSFAAFWNAYTYKVGNKPRTEKLWEKLSDVDKAQAMKSIPVYDQFLAMHPNQDKAYPETYLSQRRFENNYKLY